MSKIKAFKCPKCSALLRFKIELPDNITSWPFTVNFKHKTPDNKDCDIILAIDSNYEIREIGKKGLDEKTTSKKDTTEEKKAEDLGFKVVK